MIAPPCLTTPPPAYGGTELVVGELIDGLIDRGHEVVLFAAEGSRGGFRHRCEVVSPLGRPAWPPSDDAEARHSRLALNHVLRDGGFDLIHNHCPTAVAFAPSTPLMVSTVHHPREAKYSRIYAEHPEVTYAFISARQLTREIPLPRAEVVHHGLSPERYPLGDEAHGYVAFLGRFSACKGLHHAIDVTRIAEVPLVVAGVSHEPDRDYFDAVLADRMNQPHVTSLGEADHASKVALLTGANALLCPLEWEEPFGLVMVEAMLCGTPVLAFPHGSAPELIDDGVTGFLVDSLREMVAVLRLLERRPLDRLSCRARAIERFAAAVMVERYLALYASVLALTTAEVGHHG